MFCPLPLPSQHPGAFRAQSCLELVLNLRFFSSRKEGTLLFPLQSGDAAVLCVVLLSRRVNAAYYIKFPERAEIGTVIADSIKGQGLGTELLGELSKIASRAGIIEFEAIVASENYNMIEMVQNLGFPVVQKMEPGIIRITYLASLLPETLERFESREAIADVAKVKNFLNPKRVAVVGPSRQKDTIGGQLGTVKIRM
jgi:L-amino acid N-acyltransferase YncA